MSRLSISSALLLVAFLSSPAIAGKTREVVVEYHIRYGWAYTGTPHSHRQYDGRQIFVVRGDDPVFQPLDYASGFKNKQAAGLPIHTLSAPLSTVIPITLIDGTRCRFHLGLDDGAMECLGDWHHRPRTWMATTVMRDRRDHYKVYAWPGIT